jgi:hypothetical protein
MFEGGTARQRGNLMLHLAAQLKSLTEEPRRLHVWAYAREGAVLKRCYRCGIEHSSGRQLGIDAKKQTYFWRKNGSAWKPYPPLPQCVSLEEVLAATRAGNRRRVA